MMCWNILQRETVVCLLLSADLIISGMEVSSPLHLVTDMSSVKKETDSESPVPNGDGEGKMNNEWFRYYDIRRDNGELRQRLRNGETDIDMQRYDTVREEEKKSSSWRRILLLIVAVTIHNIPEGLAVGVGFGAVGHSTSATFQTARNLALGIGIQNFPEGIAVSLPLKAAGFSNARAIWYGQLSGLVEPVAGVLGAALVTFIVPILPYALAFAAGAMIYVVVDDIIPESQAEGNGKLASWGAIIGFIVMMSLDVSLG